MAVVIFFFIFCSILSLCNVTYVKKWLPNEASRKTSHVLCGLVSLILPSYLNLGDITILGGSILLFIFLGKKSGYITYLTPLSRKSYGDYLFLIGIYLTFLLHMVFKSNFSYVYSILALTISDSIAVLGPKLQEQLFPSWQRAANGKTYMGFALFFVSTLVIGIGIASLYSSLAPSTLMVILSISLFAAVLEFTSIWGSDNLIVPLSIYILSAIFLI